MIPTTYLMRNDLVDCKRGFVCVDCIYNDKVLVRTTPLDENSEYFEVPIAEIDPIPLTKERLIKLGFDDCGDYMRYLGNRQKFYYDGSTFNIVNVYGEHKVPIWNVHELQNLLRSMGYLAAADIITIQI